MLALLGSTVPPSQNRMKLFSKMTLDSNLIGVQNIIADECTVKAKSAIVLTINNDTLIEIVASNSFYNIHF